MSIKKFRPISLFLLALLEFSAFVFPMQLMNSIAVGAAFAVGALAIHGLAYWRGLKAAQDQIEGWWSDLEEDDDLE